MGRQTCRGAGDPTRESLLLSFLSKRAVMHPRLFWLCVLLCVYGIPCLAQEPSAAQRERWLNRFPEADLNRDGRLSVDEALAFRKRLQRDRRGPSTSQGAPRDFEVDPGWNEERFPDDAVCYRSPDQIAKLYGKVTSLPKPTDGSLRIVATGHSFMGPGFRTLPEIAKAGAYKKQTLLTHTGGGITGSARYKWEQENGIFQFEGKPKPKLLASIANAQWDAMIWGPYFNDRPEYYRCWIDFCLKYNPEMRFFLSDAWPQLYQLGEVPESENALSVETIERMGEEKNKIYGSLIEQLNEQSSGQVYALPTSDAMVLAARYYHEGKLPGVEGIHRAVGGKERSLWRDTLGHLGPGFDRLEGYVFYATLYRRSPELIKGDIDFNGGDDYPSRELDRTFREIAWQAVIHHPLSGVTDRDRNGIGD